LVPYPADIIAEIDSIVSHGGRTAFLVELARRELKRQRLLEFFKRTEPAWKPEDHPEIDDAGEWVRHMRAESETRLDRIDNSDRTCLDVARELGVIGIAEDLPEDLSTNPKHFEGFGED
jgi:hypothetical protein